VHTLGSLAVLRLADVQLTVGSQVVLSWPSNLSSTTEAQHVVQNRCIHFLFRERPQLLVVCQALAALKITGLTD